MRQKDLAAVPFVYRPCKQLPGMIAIPVSELNERILVDLNNLNKSKKEKGE